MEQGTDVDQLGSVSLGAVIARAGEGTIYEVDSRHDVVAKVFHPELKGLAEKRAKISAMTRLPPPLGTQPDGFVVLAWPSKLIDEPDGRTGFLMPRIDTSSAVEIHCISNPSHRADPRPSTPQWTKHITWQHLLTIASNLCLAVDAAHQAQAVIGDFQERNILVSDTARVTLVDCDSFQFTDDAGRQFLCGVGRPEFTAPELADVDLRQHPRETSSDLFALAVHIHLLLMGGNHPFLRGTWTKPGDQPTALHLASIGAWAGGPGSTLGSHSLAPSPEFLPLGLHRLFVKAFTEGADRPAARPSATEWRKALLAVRLIECRRGHQIPVDSANCPWCAIDNERERRRRTLTSLKTTANQQVSRTEPAPRSEAAPNPTNRSAPRSVASVAGTQDRKKAIPKTFRQAAANRRPPKVTTQSTTTNADLSEQVGRKLFTLFKLVAIPGVLVIALVTLWIFWVVISRLVGV